MLSKTKLLMHEKVEYLFVQKTQGQNKLHPPLLTILLQILFNLNFSIRIFAITLIITFNFLFILFNFLFTFTTFSNIYLRARILPKKSEPLTARLFQLPIGFDGRLWFVNFMLHEIKIVRIVRNFPMLYCAVTWNNNKNRNNT